MMNLDLIWMTFFSPSVMISLYINFLRNLIKQQQQTNASNSGGFLSAIQCLCFSFLYSSCQGLKVKGVLLHCHCEGNHIQKLFFFILFFTRSPDELDSSTFSKLNKEKNSKSRGKFFVYCMLLIFSDIILVNNFSYME